MQVTRALSRKNGMFTLLIRANFSAAEMDLLKSSNFMNYKIRLRDMSPSGKGTLFMNFVSAFQAHIGKIRNRWSVALSRTTGFILIDTIYAMVSVIAYYLYLLFRLVFGRRRRLSDAIRGIKVQSRRLEKIKEAEIFILASLAAVEKAMAYARKAGSEQVFSNGAYLSEIRGLDFSGTGGLAEGEMITSEDIAGELASNLQ